MLAVVLSILLVVLISGAVLWIVGEHPKPTSEHSDRPSVAALAEPVPEPEPALPPRRPATSRRRPPPPVAAAPPTGTGAAVALAPGPATVTARMTGAPLPRHRLRSGVLMVALVALVGVLVAVVVAVVLAAVALGLRAAVTS